jgi:excinuclease ABC subunit C
MTVIGVAKGKQRNAGNEKIYFSPLKAYLPNTNKDIDFIAPLILDKNDPILYYIQRLRDESHRFAISSQRNKQKSLIKKSILSEIPSIGAKRKKILLMHFSSIKDISDAPINELNKIAGISLNSAKEIFNFFQSIKN